MMDVTPQTAPLVYSQDIPIVHLPAGINNIPDLVLRKIFEFFTDCVDRSEAQAIAHSDACVDPATLRLVPKSGLISTLCLVCKQWKHVLGWNSEMFYVVKITINTHQFTPGHFLLKLRELSTKYAKYDIDLHIANLRSAKSYLYLSPLLSALLRDLYPPNHRDCIVYKPTQPQPTFEERIVAHVLKRLFGSQSVNKIRIIYLHSASGWYCYEHFERFAKKRIKGSRFWKLHVHMSPDMLWDHEQWSRSNQTRAQAQRSARICDWTRLANYCPYELRDEGSSAFIYRGSWTGKLSSSFERKSISFPSLAIKKIKKTTTEKDLHRINRELHIWRSLAHPNIVPFVGVIRPEAGEKPGNVHLVSEWMPRGNLQNYLKSANPLPSQLNLIRGIARGLDYLHRNRVIHADLKSPNVLIDRFGSPRLSDFGLSRRFRASQCEDIPLSSSLSVNFVEQHLLHSRSPTKSHSCSPGTFRWMARELIIGEQTKATFQTDVWAFAVTVWEVYSLALPFEGLDRTAITIRVGFFDLRPLKPDSMPPTIWKVVSSGWASEPGKRLTMRQATQVLEELPY